MVLTSSFFDSSALILFPFHTLNPSALSRSVAPRKGDRATERKYSNTSIVTLGVSDCPFVGAEVSDCSSFGGLLRLVGEASGFSYLS